MNDLAVTLGRFGIVVPGTPELIEAAIAAVLAVAAILVGILFGRWSCPPLSDFWETRGGHHAEGLSQRLGKLLRHGGAALLLAILFNVYPWHLPASFLIGLALAVATAGFAKQLLRGLRLPRWATYVVVLILFVAILSSSVGGLAPITSALERIGVDVGSRRWSLLSVLTIAITILVLFAAVRLVTRILGHSIGSARSLDPTQKLLAQKLAGIAVIVVAFLVGIDIVGIDLTAFAVFSGAFGLAVGFGFQKTFGNLIAGIILLMDRSIKPGDVIVVGDSFGWVNKIGVRAVSVITRDGKEHLIPNENLMTQEVENWSYSDRNVRVRIPVGISYDSDIHLAQKLMLQAAVESPRVLASPQPRVWLMAFGESRIEFEIRVWITDPEGGVGNMQSDVLTRIWDLFKANGIVLPYPQRDLHVRSWSPEARPPEPVPPADA